MVQVCVSTHQSIKTVAPRLQGYSTAALCVERRNNMTRSFQEWLDKHGSDCIDSAHSEACDCNCDYEYECDEGYDCDGICDIDE